MHARSEGVLEHVVDEAVAFETAFPGESRRDDLDAKMRLGARTVAGVPRVTAGVIRNDKLRRRKALAKPRFDQLFDRSLAQLRHDCPFLERRSKSRAHRIGFVTAISSCRGAALPHNGRAWT